MKGVAGLHGWQWVFLLEGVPAIILGVITWFVLADNPRTAAWLSPEEKAEVAHDLASDEAVHLAANGGSKWLSVTRDSITYFMWSSGVYGLNFFLPKILVARGAAEVATGWFATLTFGVGALAMYWASHQRSFRPLPFLIFAAGAGFAGAGQFHSLPGAVISFCLAAMGLLSSLPIFWSLAASRLSGRSAGAAIAIVNSVGAVGAAAGPYAIGWLHDRTHSYSAGLWAIAGCLVVGALLTVNAAVGRAVAGPEPLLPR